MAKHFAPTAFDRAVGRWFPGWGRRRLANRYRLFATQRSIERAEHLAARWIDEDDRTRAHRWQTAGLTPDGALQLDLEELRRHSHELYQTDTLAASFINGRTDNIIGRGIRSTSRIRALPGRISPEQARSYADAVNADFGQWAQRAGINGESLWQVQRLAQRSMDLDGDCLVVFHTDQNDPRRPFPLAVEVVEAARVDTPPHLAGNPLVTMGVERNRQGQVVAYHVSSLDPADTSGRKRTWTRIDRLLPNGLPQAVLLFEQRYPGQTRGIPSLSVSRGSIKDRKDYSEAVMIGEQTAACFAAFVKSETDPETLAAASASDSTTVGKRLQDIEPGTVQYLAPDQEISFANPNRPSGTFAGFMAYHERSAAQGLDYPYELLIKDWRGLNYSSGRLSLTDGRIRFGCAQQLFAEQFCAACWAHVCNFSALFGALADTDLDPLAYRSEPWIYEAAAHIPPGWPWIDPQVDGRAAMERVEGNLSTLEDELAAEGRDYESTLDRRQFEVEDLARRGLPTVMPMMNRDQVDQEQKEKPAGGSRQAE